MLLLDIVPQNSFCWSTHLSFTTNRPSSGSQTPLLTTPILSSKADNNEEVDQDTEWIPAEIAEVIQNNGPDPGNVSDDDEDWMPDREKAKIKREKTEARQAAAINEQAKQKERAKKTKKVQAATSTPKNDDPTGANRASPYTDEEEDVIRSMGGKTKETASKREPGFLGDCTLQEIATDYSVPVCYLADVVCMWGAPVPINVHDRLGDLVTGEQAFALLEAVNSLDVSALHDRYSNQSLINVCGDYNMDLSEAFEMAVKEGWSLPFGVQTVLRVEQEEELLRVLGAVTF